MTLANYVHKFYPGQVFGDRSKRFDIEHGSGDAFDGSVILLDDVVEVLALTDHKCNCLVFYDLASACLVAAAFVHASFREPHWHAWPFQKIAPLRSCHALNQQEVNRLAYRVCGRIKICWWLLATGYWLLTSDF